ncbi:hypothetical protein ISF6_3554 [Piscinibacter sakaiensis]|uniref:TonB C-terminal domain-containing protein n=1 Tax=Piscinibacter sakaiensis TaxID=1547922 RepID=A0A0K8P4Y6_PISS1|nr:hypothetical protein ISF6_3554 [Piscinibacter sakaiensis]
MLLAAAAALPAAAQRAGPLEPPGDAVPLTVVQPVFPAGAGAPPGGVRVEVSGTVRADGRFEPATVRADPGVEAYGDAVRAVVGSWGFLPPVDEARCVPTDGAVQLSVWFEGSAAAPRVYVSRPPPAPRPPVPVVETLQRTLPTLHDGVEGWVIVLSKLAPDGGILGTAVRASSPRGLLDEAVLGIARRQRHRWTVQAPEVPACLQQQFVVCYGPGLGVARHPVCP